MWWVIAGIVVLVVDFFWGGHILPTRTPKMELEQRSDGDKVLTVVIDGFLGDSKKRLEDVKHVIEGDILWIRPRGWRYDAALWAEAIAVGVCAYNAQHRYNRVVLVGGSLGAKVAHEATRRLENLKFPAIDQLIMIDPLHGPEGPKIPLGRWIDAIRAQPGAFSSLLWGWVAVMAIIGKLPWRYNRHQWAGVLTPASFLADQGMATNRPPVQGEVRAEVTIIHVPPQDDDVLRPSEVAAWRRRYPAARVVTTPLGETGHMGIDTEPDVWRAPLRDALQ